jgi:hypothetical protein
MRQFPQQLAARCSTGRVRAASVRRPTKGPVVSDAAWFVDGAYAFKVWQALSRSDRLDYSKLRNHLESTFQVSIDEAYYFSA